MKKIYSLLVVFFLLFQEEIFGMPISLAKISGPLILVWWFVIVFFTKKKNKIKIYKIDYYIGLALIISFLWTLKNIENQTTLSVLTRNIYIVIVFYTIRYSLKFYYKTISPIILGANLIIKCALINAVVMVLEKVFPGKILEMKYAYSLNEVTQRTGGLIEQNFSNYLVSLALVSLFYMINKENKRYKFLTISMIIFIFFTSFLTLSRTGFIFNTFTIIFSYLFLYKSKNKLGFFSLISIFLLPFIYRVYEVSFKKRFSDISSNYGSSNDRLRLLFKSFKSFIESPLVGKGYFHSNSAAHNTYLQLLGDFGLVGMMLFFCFIFYILRNINRIKINLDRNYFRMIFVVSLLYMLLLTLTDKFLYFLLIVTVPLYQNYYFKKIKFVRMIKSQQMKNN